MSLKILIAEDNQKIAQAYYKTLTSRGHDITLSYDGEEAIEKYKNELQNNNVKEQFPFDLVIVDQSMPKKDGATLVGEILDLRPNQRILFATAHEDMVKQNFGKIRRGVEVLNKPFSLHGLIKNVETKVIPKVKTRMRTGQFRRWDGSGLSADAGPGSARSSAPSNQTQKIN